MFIDPADTALVVIDLQERLVPAMSDFEPCGNRVEMLLKGAVELKLDTIITEQYPKGLGTTLPRFAELLPEGTPIIAKTGFSAFEEPAFRTALGSRSRKTLIFCGIESHVCVLQSLFDARERGFQVFLAADAVTSRKAADRDLALQAARAAGATPYVVGLFFRRRTRYAQNPTLTADFGTIFAVIKI